MLVVLSPAKTLDLNPPKWTKKQSQGEFLNKASALVDVLRSYRSSDLESLMGISSKLAELNHQRYQEWHTPFTLKNAKQAIFAFKGDVYTGIEIGEWDDEDLLYSQNHLRILSGLYGVLRPLDLMQPYRLEMGTRLPTDAGENLYEYWGDSISKSLNKTLKKQGSNLLINLASNEYFKSVDQTALKATVLTPVFKDYKNDQYKIISFLAKKARGMMAKYIVQERLENPEDLKKFREAGYRYSAKESTDTELVFLRKERK
ncbi:MAG: peroxide stress protein YaaA [Waddliaceae bacterium]|nr:peroxide stress protein YaaA [Waddliaceae bacterium]